MNNRKTRTPQAGPVDARFDQTDGYVCYLGASDPVDAPQVMFLFGASNTEESFIFNRGACMSLEANFVYNSAGPIEANRSIDVELQLWNGSGWDTIATLTLDSEAARKSTTDVQEEFAPGTRLRTIATVKGALLSGDGVLDTLLSLRKW